MASLHCCCPTGCDDMRSLSVTYSRTSLHLRTYLVLRHAKRFPISTTSFWCCVIFFTWCYVSRTSLAFSSMLKALLPAASWTTLKFDCSLNEKNFFCTDCQDPTSKFDNLSSEFHNFTSQFHNTISKFHNSSFTIRPSSFGIRPQSFTIRVSESVLHFSQSTSTNSSTAAFLGSWVLTRATCTFRAQFPFFLILCLPIWICTVLRVGWALQSPHPLPQCLARVRACLNYRGVLRVHRWAWKRVCGWEPNLSKNADDFLCCSMVECSSKQLFHSCVHTRK